MCARVHTYVHTYVHTSWHTNLNAEKFKIQKLDHFVQILVLTCLGYAFLISLYTYVHACIHTYVCTHRYAAYVRFQRQPLTEFTCVYMYTQVLSPYAFLNLSLT